MACIVLNTKSRDVGWTSKLSGGAFAAWVKFLMEVKDGGWGGKVSATYFDAKWFEKNNVTSSEWTAMIAAASKDRAIAPEGDKIAVMNWNVYQTDTTDAERQRTYRQQHQVDVTGFLASSKGADFVKFWAAYPSKVGKKMAVRSWLQAKDRPRIEAVLAAIEAQKKGRKWKEGYIPNPATWLNQGRWADEPEEKVGGPGGTYREGDDLSPETLERQTRGEG